MSQTCIDLLEPYLSNMRNTSSELMNENTYYSQELSTELGNGSKLINN